MKFEKSLKKTLKLARVERDMLVDRLEQLDNFINAAGADHRSGRNPKIQRRSKRHRKPMSKATRLKIAKARKAAWAKKNKEAAAA